MNINFKGTALAMAAVAGLSMGAAHAAFTAYNDCAMSSTGNVTNYQIQNNVASPVYTTNGLLKDYATGFVTGVTATATASGALTLWTDPIVNVPYTAGTDAANYFTGKVNFVGSPELNSATDYYQYTFSGLNTSKTYEFVTTMNRAASNYPTRIAKYTISGASAFVNSSSTGTTKSTSVVANDSTTFCNGYNTVNGYVASWTGIKTTTGEFSVKVMQGTPGTKAYGFGMFALKEVDAAVPEPGSMLALASGLFGLGGFAIRRRK